MHPRNYLHVVAIVMAASALDARADTPDVPIHPPETAETGALRKAAAAALSQGEFARARRLYEQLSGLDPGDASAVREAGRAAQALCEFERAADLLQRADVLANHVPDPELHYLRGEALFALGRVAEARDEHVAVEQQLADVTPSRQSQLWLARVYARRGELARADAVYQALTPPPDRPVDPEVSLNRAEAHILNHDWNGAKHILEDLLARSPRHDRAQDMLAWVLETIGRGNDELALRKVIVRQPTSRQLFDYGRALERSGDWAAAFRMYRSARELVFGAEDPELTAALERMKQRNSVELAAAVRARSDQQTSSLGEQAGLAVPFGGEHHHAFGAWHERLTSDATSRSGSAAELWTAVALHHGLYDAVIGGKLGYLYLPGNPHAKVSMVSGAGFLSTRGQPLRHLKLSLDGELNALWRETPLTLLEGGRVTSVTANAYGLALDDRVVAIAGGQLRRLTLADLAGGRDPETSQRLGWLGLDVVAWANFARSLEGGILDDDLRWPTQLADSVVVSYRHYELRSGSQPEFTARLSMLPRASIDEGTLVARKVVAGNRVGGELRGALGWDRERSLAISHAGVSLLAVPARSMRISLVFDIGAESPNGFRNQVRTGWVSYHADL